MIEVNNSMHFSRYFSIETSNRLVKWEYNLNGTYCPKTCTNSMQPQRNFPQGACEENKDLGNDNSLIGQFGVGFYSAFMVAEKDDDNYKFTEPSRVHGLVKNYSQFVSFLIFTWQEKSRTVEDPFRV
ncbi:unnamed protein product [Lactuca saligna]|uniref:Uncharacterized protein n=1 Tax=Lactuca saligna TaxID=75948 RepID=A0AA36E9J3_LACSI|nr:unnamed protein product [Lactuca saligna]